MNAGEPTPPTGGSSDVAAELVDDLASLEPLRDEWRALAVERSNAFITPEWYFSWLRHYGDAATPYVAVVRRAGDLIGLMPCVLAGAGRSRSLQFVGGNLGDHFHPVAAEKDESAVVKAAAAALTARGNWSVAVFHNVVEHAPWVTELVAASRRNLRSSWDTPQPLPYVPLEGLTMESYLAERSAKLRRELSYDLRRLERDHEVAFRSSKTIEDITTDMEQFFRLHDIRWSDRGGSSMSSDRARAFLTDFAGIALEAGWLRLWFLHVDGEPVAAWLGWHIGTSYAFFQAGFDPEWRKFSPGLLLVGHTLREAFAEGAAEYDMLLGDEGYKARFVVDRRSVSTVALAPAFHPGRIVTAVDIGLRRAGRKLPAGARDRVRELAQPVLRRLPTTRRR